MSRDRVSIASEGDRDAYEESTREAMRRLYGEDAPAEDKSWVDDVRIVDGDGGMRRLSEDKRRQLLDSPPPPEPGRNGPWMPREFLAADDSGNPPPGVDEPPFQQVRVSDGQLYGTVSATDGGVDAVQLAPDVSRLNERVRALEEELAELRRQQAYHSSPIGAATSDMPRSSTLESAPRGSTPQDMLADMILRNMHAGHVPDSPVRQELGDEDVGPGGSVHRPGDDDPPGNDGFMAWMMRKLFGDRWPDRSAEDDTSMAAGDGIATVQAGHAEGNAAAAVESAPRRTRREPWYLRRLDEDDGSIAGAMLVGRD